MSIDTNGSPVPDRETAYFFHPDALLHDPPASSLPVQGTTIRFGANFVANALLTQQSDEAIRAAGLLEQMEHVLPQPADRDLVEAVHDPRYLDALERACMESSEVFDIWSPLSPATWNAAMLTAGAAVEAVDGIVDGRFRRALVLGRPSGHHAVRAGAMGACYINELAIGAERARARGLERVMIVDWDVHTGNGAEAIFWSRPDVLALSIHQEDWYPEDSGLAEMVGGAGAEGRTVNIPLPAGTNDAGYLAAIEEIVGPIAAAFEPQLIILAAGQDPSFYDPQGRMLVSMGGFRKMAARLRRIADEVCEGRLACMFQGGYSPIYAPLCAVAVAEGVLGSGATDDPFEGDTEWLVTQRGMSEATAAAIERARAVQATRWPAFGTPSIA